MLEYLNYYEDPYLEATPEDPNLCGSLFELPPITFVIDGVKYPIYPEDYIITMNLDGEIDVYKH